MRYVIQYEYRSDNGPLLVGVFITKTRARLWAESQTIEDCAYLVVPMVIVCDGTNIIRRAND